jgi:hypothetical protein
VLWVKVLKVAFIMALLFSALAIAVNSGKVQATTNVSGVISIDTTWTKANSPYTLTGDLTVSPEATLTIEAGATVNVQAYPLQVDGTLKAIGKQDEPIRFNGIIESEDRGVVIFRPSSKGWNETTKSGCIVENSIFNATALALHSSVKINNNTINSDIYAFGSPIIMYASGSPIITNNTITAVISAFDKTVVTNNIINGKIEALNSAAIANNTVKRVSIFSPYDIVLTASDTSLITNNYLRGIVRVVGSPTVSNNVIDGELDVRSGSSPIITNNTVSDLPISSPNPNDEPYQTPDQTFFLIESNSTISELFFNSTNSEFSFTVSGQSGTSGFARVKVAKTLISSPQNVRIYLDGKQLEAEITSDSDSWLLSFYYTHSVHQIKLGLATSSEEELANNDYRAWVSLAIVITVIACISIGLLMYLIKRK